MKKEGLTHKQVEHMKPAEKRFEVPAGPPSGLYLVVHPTGRKTWIYRYRFRGRTRGLTFEDPFPTMTLAQARAEANAQRIYSTPEKIRLQKNSARKKQSARDKTLSRK